MGFNSMKILCLKIQYKLFDIRKVLEQFLITLLNKKKKKLFKVNSIFIFINKIFNKCFHNVVSSLFYLCDYIKCMFHLKTTCKTTVLNLFKNLLVQHSALPRS